MLTCDANVDDPLLPTEEPSEVLANIAHALGLLLATDPGSPYVVVRRASLEHWRAQLGHVLGTLRTEHPSGD